MLICSLLRLLSRVPVLWISIARMLRYKDVFNSRGSTLGICGWGCAVGTLEPLTYTRASPAKFWYPILEQTPQIPPILQ